MRYFFCKFQWVIYVVIQRTPNLFKIADYAWDYLNQYILCLVLSLIWFLALSKPFIMRTLYMYFFLGMLTQYKARVFSVL